MGRMSWAELESEVAKRVRQIVDLFCEYHEGKCAVCQAFNICFNGDAETGKSNAAKVFTEQVVLQTWSPKKPKKKREK